MAPQRNGCMLVHSWLAWIHEQRPMQPIVLIRQHCDWVGSGTPAKIDTKLINQFCMKFVSLLSTSYQCCINSMNFVYLLYSCYQFRINCVSIYEFRTNFVWNLYQCYQFRIHVVPKLQKIVHNWYKIDTKFNKLIQHWNNLDGIWSQQREENMGGFKSTSYYGTTSDLMSTANLYVQLPIKPGIFGLFADVGAFWNDIGPSAGNSVKVNVITGSGLIFGVGALFENVFSPKGWQQKLPKCLKSANVWFWTILQWFYPFPHAIRCKKLPRCI